MLGSPLFPIIWIMLGRGDMDGGYMIGMGIWAGIGGY